MTNLEQLKNKFKVNKEKTAESIGSETKENFLKSYKLENGKNKARIVPFEDGSIVKKVSVHMNLGIPFLCPKKHNNTECPTCEFGWELYNKAGKKHTKDEKGNDISKAFLSQDKYVFQMVFRAKEEADIKEYGFPHIRFYDASATLATKLIGYFDATDDDGEELNVGDIISGYDVILTKDDVKAKQRQQSVDSELARKPSPVISVIPTTSEIFVPAVEKMFEHAPNLQERFKVKTAEEIKELMLKYKNKASNSSSEEDNEASDNSAFKHTSRDFEEAIEAVESEETLENMF